MQYPFVYEHEYVSGDLVGRANDYWIVRQHPVRAMTDTQVHVELWPASDGQPEKVLVLDLHALVDGVAPHPENSYSGFFVLPVTLDVFQKLTPEDQGTLRICCSDPLYHQFALEFHRKGDGPLQGYLIDRGISNVVLILKAHEDETPDD